ncbi:GNAT family N-acetyltransferase [Streptomyces sp. NPDC051561]|uniref:GNAT family N-acetyltransferase n=1 Tax=Streptomyces sp. NPDC051561 TaxID=3365658 RepID=UPI00379E2194
MIRGAAASPLTFAELSGLGLRLRAWTERDVPAILRGLGDPEVRRWEPGEPVDEEAALAYVRSRAEGWERGDLAQFCVTDEASGEVLGAVGLHKIEFRRECAGIGYWLLPEARGRGVVTRAVELCTRWGFERLALHRIELGHAVANEASCRVAVRSGYLLEGTARGGLPAPAPGAHHDMHVHARLATDPAPAIGGGDARTDAVNMR